MLALATPSAARTRNNRPNAGSDPRWSSLSNAPTTFKTPHQKTPRNHPKTPCSPADAHTASARDVIEVDVLRHPRRLVLMARRPRALVQRAP